MKLSKFLRAKGVSRHRLPEEPQGQVMHKEALFRGKVRQPSPPAPEARCRLV
jgi:hypothetical protein